MPRLLWLDWLAVFLVGFAFFVATCAPDVLPGDCGIYQLRASQFPHIAAEYRSPDLVHAHTLYLAVAKVFTFVPAGCPAYRVNLASAWFGAMTLASVFACVRLMTGSRWAALLGTLSLGLGHTFWAYSVIADSRPLVTACLATELLLIVIWARSGKARWLMAAWLINGLSLNNHMLAALATPAYLALTLLLWRRGRLRGVHVLSCLGLWVVGASVYLWTILRLMIEGGDVLYAIRSATTGGWPAANLQITPSLLAKTGTCLLLQYPTLLIVLALVAIRAKPFYRHDALVKGVILIVAVIHFLFSMRYPVPDQYKFFLPFYTCVAILIGLGAWEIIRRWRWSRWVCLVLAIIPVGICTVLPSMARRVAPRLFTGGLSYCDPYLLYSDPYEFYFTPWQRGNYSVRRYAEDVFRSVPRDGVLIVDYVLGAALLYTHVCEHRRPDVEVVFAFEAFPWDGLLRAPTAGSAPQWKRPVYSLGTTWPYVPKAFGHGFRVVKEGILYRVEPAAR
ncbi:MAG: DUF2723 domain-containing protein [Phycisphaerae bacterium]|nr:DUF2723 domain-containing protein [Phycisphaerae bacterium]